MPLYRASGSFANLTSSGNALGSVGPVNHNLVAWSTDPTHNVNSTVLTGGTVYLTALYPAKDASITKLYFHINAVATTPTAGQNFVGLYSSAGTRLQTTGVDSEVLATGLITVTITAQAVTAGSFYWVGMVFNAATPPSVGRAAGTTGIGAVANVGLAAASYRYAINGTGQTSLPASITPASNTQTTFGGPWVAMGV